MSDANANQLAQLQALLAQAQQQPAPANGWASPQPAATGRPITGVAIPVKLQTPIGDVRVYLQFPAECAANPQALLGAVQALSNAGLPVDAWQPRESSGGWGGNSGNGGGGWGGQGGGYNRGGFGGRGQYGRRW